MLEAFDAKEANVKYRKFLIGLLGGLYTYNVAVAVFINNMGWCAYINNKFCCAGPTTVQY